MTSLALHEPQENRTPKRRPVSAVLAALFVAAFLIGFAPTAANAGSAVSTTGYYTTSGSQYRNWATVSTFSTYANATTSTGPTNASAPSGWVGSQGRLFQGTTLICAGGTSYSSQSINAGAVWNGTSCNRTTPGAYSSYGVSYTWNGSGYATNYTYKSPNQSF